MKHFILPLIALLFATPVFAQVELNGSSLFLSVAPQYPKPGEAMTLTVQSPLMDLSGRMITWKDRGAVVLTGEGEVSYKTIAPVLDDHADYTVQVEGVADTASISITPLTVDLLWEADSYAPRLYRGRHLVSQGSTVTLQALPHLSKNGIEIPVSQLIFIWKKDDTTLTAQSGRGRSSIDVPISDFTDAAKISVNVSTLDKKLNAEKSVDLTYVDPTVRLYTEHPLYGTMYHSALPAKLAVSDVEMTFVAAPYFAGIGTLNNPLLSYLWRVNKVAVDPNDEHPNVLTINAGAAGGEASVELSLTHRKNFHLDAHGAWDVIFGSAAGAGDGTTPF